MSTSYLDYLQNNFPSVSSDVLTRVSSVLENTSWDDPQTALDWNNVAVSALIEVELSEDEAVRSFYLEIAYEALSNGIEVGDHPLCIAHLALFYSLLGESTKATELAFPALVSTLHHFYSSENALVGLIYLPAKEAQANHQQLLLSTLLQAENGYQQALLLFSEALRKARLVLYNPTGVRLLTIQAQLNSQLVSTQLKLGIYSLAIHQLEGLLYLHRCVELRPDYAPAYQALYIAYQDLNNIEAAHTWFRLGGQQSQQAHNSFEWRWSALQPEQEFTYIPFEKDVLLAIEPSFRSIATQVLIAEEDWFEKEMEFWRQRIQPGMTIFDVGANIGVYTFSAAQRVGSEGRVIAVEPFSGCIRCLRQTCEANRFNQVKVYEGAASNYTGKSNLVLQNASELNSIITNDQELPEDRTNIEEIACFTLDHIAGQEQINRVDFLKIDAEGHELQVLEGSQEILKQFSPVILYENLAGDRPAALPVTEFLKQQGYEFFYYKPYIRSLVKIKPEDDISMILNIIAIPSHKVNLFV